MGWNITTTTTRLSDDALLGVECRMILIMRLPGVSFRQIAKPSFGKRWLPAITWKILTQSSLSHPMSAAMPLPSPLGTYGEVFRVTIGGTQSVNASTVGDGEDITATGQCCKGSPVAHSGSSLKLAGVTTGLVN